MIKKVVLLAALCALSLGIQAEEKELLRIIGEDKQFVVQTKSGPLSLPAP